jgi:glutaredoxin|tara:strand:- start:1301 stop:1555 length:255 start_codon:yes stop_codon:yes gene_type:complete
MAKVYHMWGKANCPYCTKAQAELTERKLTHTFYIMDEKLEALNEIKEAHSWPTVPLIIAEDENGVQTFIGGYTDLHEKLTAEDT